MVHRLGFLAVLALALAGCATPSERRLAVRDDESFAMHILRAADIQGLRDAPREAATRFGGLETGVVGASDIGRIGHVALSAANPLGGASALGAGLGAGLLSFFLIPGDAPAESSAIVAWAPTDFAETPFEAEEKFYQLIKTAFLAAAEGTEFSDYKFIEDDIESRFSNSGMRTRSFVFEKRDEKCRNMRWGRCRIIIAVGNRSHVSRERSPKIIGDQQTWEFARGNGMIPLWAVAEDGEFPHSFRAMADDLGLYTAASQRLPEWLFIYIAPNRVGFRDESGELKLYPLPMVLNQGRAHYFIKGARGGREVQTAF